MPLTARLEKIASLQAIVIAGRAGGPCVTLFHGYGADAQDLAPLSQYLGLGDEVTWVFPEGFLEVPIAPGFEGRAWFPIDLAAYDEAIRTGTFRDLAQSRPPGLNEARDRAQKLLAELRSRHSHVIWGGFSQGAMLSLDVALNGRVRPDRLVLLSGTLIDEAGWSEALKRVEPIRYFQSHGDRDPILSYAAASELHEKLQAAGWPGEFRAFDGGHEIPVPVLNQARGFLATAVREARP